MGSIRDSTIHVTLLLLLPGINMWHSPKVLGLSDLVSSLHQGNELHMAAESGNVDAVKLLIKKGANVNITYDNGVSK